MIEIDAQSPEKDREFAVWARAMYDLLGSNMTSILGHDGPDWRPDEEFRKWEEGVLTVFTGIFQPLTRRRQTRKGEQDAPANDCPAGSFGEVGAVVWAVMAELCVGAKAQTD